MSMESTLSRTTTSGLDESTWHEIHPGKAESDPRRHRRRRRALERSLAVAVPLLAIAAWQILSSNGVLESRYFPAPSKILSAWGELIESGEFQRSLWASVKRIVVGYVLGCGAAVALGLAIGFVPLLRASLEPTIAALYTVPKLAILPLLLLVFGLGETSKILLVALTCFFVVLINTISAVAGVSQKYLDVARTVHAGWFATICHVTLPASLPNILTGLRIASGLAVVVIVGAEFVAAEAGLGFLVWNSWNLGVPEYMYVGIAAISLIGVLATALLRGFERLVTPWNR